MHHLGHRKVFVDIAKHYFWPGMQADIRRWVNNCANCENEKARRRQLHGMFKAQTTSGPFSRYVMDFQGQGKAISGEREALAILDSFSKTATVLALPNREAPTLVPALLDAIHFHRGRADVFHSDAAPEFLSRLFKSVAEVLGTATTDTRGHNAQGNAEVEQFWRYWNRSMRILSPQQYREWPRFTRRIVHAYNTAPHSSLNNHSPFEIDHGIPPRNPYTPNPQDPPLLDILPDYNLYVDELRATTTAFRRMAHDHQRYLKETTAERLNMHGIPATFAVGSRVKIYVPPTQTQLDLTGRRAKHITAWRGPCTVTAQLSDTAYSVTEDCSNRTFERTITNIRPFRSTLTPPAPHHDPLTANPPTPGTLVVIRDTPDSRWHVARVTTTDAASITVQYLGTTTADIRTARFRNMWTAPDDGRQVITNTRPSAHHPPYTGTIDTDALPDLLLSTTVALTNSGTMTKATRLSLFHLSEEMFVH